MFILLSANLNCYFFLSRRLLHYIISFSACQELFLFFSILFCTDLFFVAFCDSQIIIAHSLLFVNNFFTLFSSKRRRRDLNPRAAINDLHPFQGCPFGQLGYFSIAARTRAIFGYTLEKEFLRILFACFLVSPPSGEDGIRTHVPLRTNGFQDRLVMTTSIPLHVFWPNQNITDNIILSTFCQYPFFIF